MSTKTTNLEMTLLAEEDNFDTNVYNENFQKTDDKIGELNSMLGSEELTTTSQTHSGAINELNKKSNEIKIYSSLHSLGLKGADVTKSILLNTLENYQCLEMPLFKSDWASFDFPAGIGSYVIIKCFRGVGSYAYMELFDLHYGKKYLSTYDGSSGTWTAWSTLN